MNDGACHALHDVGDDDDDDDDGGGDDVGDDDDDDDELNLSTNRWGGGFVPGLSQTDPLKFTPSYTLLLC